VISSIVLCWWRGVLVCGVACGGVAWHVVCGAAYLVDKRASNAR
jgi:hypothetical protein